MNDDYDLFNIQLILQTLHKFLNSILVTHSFFNLGVLLDTVIMYLINYLPILIAIIHRGIIIYKAIRVYNKKQKYKDLFKNLNSKK